MKVMENCILKKSIASRLQTVTIKGSKISIFPNPTSEYFDFKIGEQYKANKLQIVSLGNKVILSKDVSGKLSGRINISKLNRGIYIVKFENDGEITGSGKLVIVR